MKKLFLKLKNCFKSNKSLVKILSFVSIFCIVISVFAISCSAFTPVDDFKGSSYFVPFVPNLSADSTYVTGTYEFSFWHDGVYCCGIYVDRLSVGDSENQYDFPIWQFSKIYYNESYGSYMQVEIFCINADSGSIVEGYFESVIWVSCYPDTFLHTFVPRKVYSYLSNHFLVADTFTLNGKLFGFDSTSVNSNSWSSLASSRFRKTPYGNFSYSSGNEYSSFYPSDGSERFYIEIPHNSLIISGASFSFGPDSLGSYDDGYHKGYEVGFDHGEIEGYETGKSVGYDLGYDEGYESGESVGYDLGYDDGYATGYDDGINVNDSALLGQNLIGDTLSAPLEALNQFTLFVSPNGINVTLGLVFGGCVGLVLLLAFLKLFAGG